MNAFDRVLRQHGHQPLKASKFQVLQVNLGLRCNLRCRHCHLECSPDRREVMNWGTMEAVLRAASGSRGCLVDLTGGSPELSPHFRRFVGALRDQGHPVLVRSNLAIFQEPGMEGLPSFYERHRIRIAASLPCYLEENVRAQRGRGVWESAIEAMRRLNAVGYGVSPELPLNLVYTPCGPFLPPDQGRLESEYRKELWTRFGLRFTRLLTMTNMLLGRFRKDMEAKGRTKTYLALLKASFNPLNLDGLMCRHQVSISWDGRLHDCDFNLAQRLGLAKGLPEEVTHFSRAALEGRKIVTGEHCFGCTAGCGSSCNGALSEPETESSALAAVGAE
ncbi:MAG: arsenosugar biosynthesis radical SAM protein ArsS [Deltaproteobacteria bacterium]|nr:arsenosugar biosynthesis radical SAM protein ArsS [Deltaproteobacteria bacterium]